MIGNKKWKTELIQQIINPVLKDIDFPEIEYQTSPKPPFWTAYKREGDLSKRILIDDLYGNTLKLSLVMNVYAQEPLNAIKNSVDDEPFKARGNSEWLYNSRQEFRDIICMYRDLLKKHALSSFEKMSISPIEARPTKEMNLYLYNNHEQLYSASIQKWGLSGKSMEYIYSYLCELIQKNKEKNFTEVKLLLIEIASVYSTILIDNYGGKWVWNDDYNNALILDIGSSKRLSYPLNEVIGHWRIKVGASTFKRALEYFK